MVTQFDTGLLTPKPDNVPVTPANPLPVILKATGGAATIVEGFKAPAAVATPEPLVGVSTLVSQVTLFAQKTGRTGANATTIYWGWSSANDSQLNPLAVGASITITAPEGKLIDLALLYIDATTLTDGVRWVSMT